MDAPTQEHYDNRLDFARRRVAVLCPVAFEKHAELIETLAAVYLLGVTEGQMIERGETVEFTSPCPSTSPPSSLLN